MTRRRLLAIGVGVLSSTLFVVVAFRQLDTGSLLEALAGARPWPWLPLAVGAYLAGHLARGWRTRLLVSREAKLSLGSATSVVVVGYAVNNLLPVRLGEVARAGMLSRTSGLPFVQSASVTLLERILDGLALLLLLVLGSLLLPPLPWVDAVLQVGALVFGAALFGVLVVLVAPSAVLSVASRLTQPLGARVHDFALRALTELGAGLAYLRHGAGAARIAALSLLIWTLESGMFLAILPAFGLAFDPRLALVVMGVTNLGNLAPSTPGYIGPFHFFCASTLAAAGASKAVALSYALVVHASFYVPITLWGIGILFAHGLSLGEIVARARQARPLAESGARTPALRLPPAALPAVTTLAICEALLPLDELPERLDRRKILRDVARFVDDELRDLPGHLAWLLSVGMLGFRAATALRFLRSLASLPLDRRRRWVEAWAFGPLAPARQLLRALRAPALLAYHEHEAVQAVLLPKLVALDGGERTAGHA
jgi:glycosyltransferase 2 family protein